MTATSLTFAPVFAAQKLGFFAEEGIELEHLNFQGGAILQPQIANGQVDIGFAAVESLILTHAPGRNPLPLVFFYNAARSSIWRTVVLDASPIKTLKDLKGKTVGIGATTNANVPLTRAMLKELGMELGKDYSFLPIGVGAPAFRGVTNGDVDAYNTFDVNIANFESTGQKLRVLDEPARFRGLFSNGFVAHKAMLEKDPGMLAGFGRAFTKGIIVCEANPEWCVENFWQLNPETRPKAGAADENIKSGLSIMKSRMQSYTYFPKETERKFGYYPPQGWKDYVSILFDGGELPTANIDVTPIFSNALVDRFNDFDVEAVRRKALSLKP